MAMGRAVTEEDLRTKSRLPTAGYFSETYVEARNKFRWAAAALGKELNVRSEVLKVKDPDYTIDVAVVKGSSERGLAVHTSGIHGPEGYAGSAIQTAAMHDMLCRGIKPEVTTVFVHAVNPYGMAHNRRWNENNVDLNRNALTEEGWKEVLARDPNIAGYEDFRDLFVANCAPSKWFVLAGLWFKMIYLILRYGQHGLKRALVTATYRHEKGILFGGRELQPSHRLLRDFIVKNFGSVPCKEVAWIDVHTGLGPRGVDVLLLDVGGAAVQAVSKAFPGADVQGLDGSTGNSKNSQAAGYELVRGSMNAFYKLFFKGAAAAKGADEALIVTQEFGTQSATLVGRSLIVENRGFHYDVPNRSYWSTYTRDAFYVRTPAWKESVLSRGLTVVNQLLQFSAQRAGVVPTSAP